MELQTTRCWEELIMRPIFNPCHEIHKNLVGSKSYVCYIILFSFLLLRLEQGPYKELEGTGISIL